MSLGAAVGAGTSSKFHTRTNSTLPVLTARSHRRPASRRGPVRSLDPHGLLGSWPDGRSPLAADVDAGSASGVGLSSRMIPRVAGGVGRRARTGDSAGVGARGCLRTTGSSSPVLSRSVSRIVARSLGTAGLLPSLLTDGIGAVRVSCPMADPRGRLEVTHCPRAGTGRCRKGAGKRRRIGRRPIGYKVVDLSPDYGGSTDGREDRQARAPGPAAQQ